MCRIKVAFCEKVEVHTSHLYGLLLAGTFFAFVFAPVWIFMCLVEADSQKKCRRAEFAFEWFLTYVGPHVSCQQTSIFESGVAKFAF